MRPIFVNVGERTNVTGSAKFRKLVVEGDYPAALSVARQQVEAGAQVIDVNMDEGLLDSKQAMVTFLNLIAALPEKQRVVFLMRYYDETKYEDMSEMLDTSVGALKASYHHAAKKIEKYLTEG